jgi:hypothetical protein
MKFSPRTLLSLDSNISVVYRDTINTHIYGYIPQVLKYTSPFA